MCVPGLGADALTSVVVLCGLVPLQSPLPSQPLHSDRTKGKEGVGYRPSGVRRVDIPWEHLSSLYGGDGGGVGGLPPDRSASPPHLRDRFPARTTFFLDSVHHSMRDASPAIEEILRGEASYGDNHGVGLHVDEASRGSRTHSAGTAAGGGTGVAALDGTSRSAVAPAATPVALDSADKSAAMQPVPPTKRPVTMTNPSARKVVPPLSSITPHTLFLITL